MSQAVIRQMQLADIENVVAIHLKSFPNFFLSFLGPRFLSELYSGIVSDSSGIALVYCDQADSVMGFVAGTTQPEGFYRRLIQRKLLRFFWASLGPVLKRPAIIPRLFRALNMPHLVRCEKHLGTLMSIAVAPGLQGMGLGKQLVNIFLKEAKQRGLNEVNLTTDALGNDAVNQFYLQCGFKLTRKYITKEKREMAEYLVDLRK